jgi:hypothetical protein
VIAIKIEPKDREMNPVERVQAECIRLQKALDGQPMSAAEDALHDAVSFALCQLQVLAFRDPARTGEVGSTPIERRIVPGSVWLHVASGELVTVTSVDGPKLPPGVRYILGGSLFDSAHSLFRGAHRWLADCSAEFWDYFESKCVTEALTADGNGKGVGWYELCQSARTRVAELEAELATEKDEHLKFVRLQLATCSEKNERIARLEAELDAWRNTEAAFALLSQLRADGWMVATHNDYRANGVLHTFYLLSKDGRCAKGEGKTDLAALQELIASLPKPTEAAPVERRAELERLTQADGTLMNGDPTHPAWDSLAGKPSSVEGARPLPEQPAPWLPKYGDAVRFKRSGRLSAVSGRIVSGDAVTHVYVKDAVQPVPIAELEPVPKGQALADAMTASAIEPPCEFSPDGPGRKCFESRSLCGAAQQNLSPMCLPCSRVWFALAPQSPIQGVDVPRALELLRGIRDRAVSNGYDTTDREAGDAIEALGGAR